MPIFYNPPGPYIGGHQPYDPGRNFTGASDPPPRGHPARLRPWLNVVVRAWDDPPPGPYNGRAGEYPYTKRKLYPSLLNVPPDNPKFGHPARLREWVADVRQWWDLPPPQPQRLIPNQSTSAPAVNIPKLSLQMQNILMAWDVPAWPQQPRPDVIPGRADYPPPFVPQEIPQVQLYWQQEALPPIAALIPAGGSDNPPWQHPAQGIQRYIYAYDPKLWREHGGLGMSVGPPTPPPQPDNPPLIRPDGLKIIIDQWTRSFVTVIDFPLSLPGENIPPYSVENIMAAALAWPQPDWPAQGRNLFTQGRAADNPPPYSINEIMSGALSWPELQWTSPGRGPFTAGRGADNPPGYSIEAVMAGPLAWPQSDWSSPGRGPFTPSRPADNPPGFSIQSVMTGPLSWPQTQWQPPPLPEFTQGRAPDNPPVKGVDNLRNILRAWEPPDPMPQQKSPQQTQTGPEPVPPVPPAEEAPRLGRAWWGWESFDGSNRPWWYKTLEDKRKELERMRKLRISLGILPPDEIKSLEGEIKTFNRQTPTEDNVEQMIARYEALADRAERMLEKIQEQDDEEAIMKILKDML